MSIPISFVVSLASTGSALESTNHVKEGWIDGVSLDFFLLPSLLEAKFYITTEARAVP
jgi:hypothetical protein